MRKMELEVKVLDIDKESFIKKLTELGALLKEETYQYLYTYDLPTIYGRFIDIRLQLNTKESEIKYQTALEKLRLLFFEVDNLLSSKDKKELEIITGFSALFDLLEMHDLLNILNLEEFADFMMRFKNNDKKWIRLRKTNDKTTIAVKHILAPNETSLQQMLETEIEVPNLEEANSFLEALGFSYKSYQEKTRVTYELDGYEIDIDTWPGIPTYLEIEGKSESDLEVILKKLGYTLEDTVSCTADQVYAHYGKTMFKKRELKFEDYGE